MPKRSKLPGAHAARFKKLLTHRCGLASYPFFVRGEMAESGTVYFGGSGRGQSQAPWSFALPTAAGTFDLGIMFGDLAAPDRLALRRDVAVTADVDVGTIDAAQTNAEALVPISFTATNQAPEESLGLQTFLDVRNTSVSLRNTFLFGGSGWDSVLAPASMLRPTDRQRVSLTANTEASGDLA